MSTGFSPLEEAYIGNIKQPYVCPTCTKKRSHYSFQKMMDTLWSKRQPTTLEVAIESILNDLRMDFNSEYPLSIGTARGVFDFYVPCAKLLIEGEGMAFHTSYHTSKLESSADALIRNTARDMIKISEAIKHGYYVYVIFEADLVDIQKTNVVPVVKEETINKEKYNFIRDDLAQLLYYRGCKNVHQESVVFK